MAASQVDIFGRPADDAVKAAQKDNARIAGVGLFALSRLDTLVPVFGGKSSLTLNVSDRFHSPSKGVFVRNEDAPDEPDGSVDFSVDLYSSDYLISGTGRGWSDDLRITSLLGHPISLGATDAREPMIDVCMDLNFFNYPNGEINSVCNVALTGVASFYSHNQSAAGRCSRSAVPPNVPLTAEYRRVFRPSEVQIMKENFGIPAPDEWVFTLK